MKKLMTLMIALALMLSLCAFACAESRGRQAADAAMERVYGSMPDVTYSFSHANEKFADKYYFYNVSRKGDGLTLNFQARARYEGGRATVRDLEYFFDARGPMWDNEMERVWDLVGTYTYKDNEHDFLFKVLAVDGETLTVEYDMRGVEQGGYNFPIDGSLTSKGSVTMKLKPYLGDDGSAWRITGDKTPNMWLYPFGRELTKGGQGSGLSFQGFWLKRQ